MEFKTIGHKLVARICSYCQENRLPDPGQVRTTKLVYLVECEFYRWEKKRLSDMDWIFLHYGPWSPTLSTILKEDFSMPVEQEDAGQFRPVHWKQPQFDMPSLWFNATVEGIVQRTLERFVEMPYNTLLDYVYFETAPMLRAIKGEPLDFSLISKPQLFADPVSFLSKKAFNELREKFERLSIGEEERPGREGQSDKELLQLLANIDEEGEFESLRGEVLIDEITHSKLKKDFDD